MRAQFAAVRASRERMDDNRAMASAGVADLREAGGPAGQEAVLPVEPAAEHDVAATAGDRACALAGRGVLREAQERGRDRRLRGAELAGVASSRGAGGDDLGLLEAARRGKKIGERTFQAYRRVLRRLVCLMMITERNEDVVLMMAFEQRPPPGWGIE